jgi:hypothetical protein
VGAADDRGGGSGWVELTRAPNDIEASLLRGRLNHAGIESTGVKDRSSEMAWLMGGSDQWAPVAVLVRKVQLNDARIVLAEIAFDLPAAAPDPQHKLSPGLRTRVLFWATAIGLGALLTGAALARTQAALHHCDLPLICVEGQGEGR